MNIESFRNAHRLRPFKPFAIRTAGGAICPVTHPETAWQPPRVRTLIMTIKGEQLAMLDIDHITEIALSTRRPDQEPK